MSKLEITAYDRGMHNVPWKRLEMEEQARARYLMGHGLARIVGTGPGRVYVLGQLAKTEQK